MRVCACVYSHFNSRLALASAALYAKMYTADACSCSLEEKITMAVARYLNHDEFDDESDDEQSINEQRSLLNNTALVSLQSNTEKIDMQAKGIACLQSIVFESPAKPRPGASVTSNRRLQDWPAEVFSLKKFCMDLRKPRETGLDMLSEERSSLNDVALLSLQEKIASIDMQAKGVASLYSVVFGSPHRARLSVWPTEVTCLQKFVKKLLKPDETGYYMLVPLLQYSPRSWVKRQAYRTGHKSIASEFFRSFLGYIAKISNEADIISWLVAFNYHAKEQGLRCILEVTYEQQLNIRPHTSKRKRSKTPSGGERNELSSIWQGTTGRSARNYVCRTDQQELQRIYEEFRNLYGESANPQKIDGTRSACV